MKKNLSFSSIKTSLERGPGSEKKLLSVFYDHPGESLKDQLAFFRSRGSRVSAVGFLHSEFQKIG